MLGASGTHPRSCGKQLRMVLESLVQANVDAQFIPVHLKAVMCESKVIQPLVRSSIPCPIAMMSTEKRATFRRRLVVSHPFARLVFLYCLRHQMPYWDAV